MPLKEVPKLSSPQMHILNIEQPAIRGLNIHDLEYELDDSQTPNMLNMYYRNGTFGKRYGQSVLKQFDSNINRMAQYNGRIVIHTGNKLYDGDTVIKSDLPDKEGMFINFNNHLYYIIAPEGETNGMFLDYNGTTITNVVAKVPDVIINAKPDLSVFDAMEDYNMLTSEYRLLYHGDGTSKEFKLYGEPTSVKEVKVDNAVTTAYTFSDGKVTLNTAASEGTNNVAITVYKAATEYYNEICNNKYWCAYGGNNKSRIVLAGGGKAKYYYSDVFDATYWPESNYGILGNSEEDITGLAVQYSIMVAFKPNEMYQFSYYTQSSNTTTNDREYGIGAFQTAIINDQVGCDVPGSIQLINNQLVWANTKMGLFVLNSTNILDERNVRPISRNIEGGIRTNGILEEHELTKAVSAEWDKKYFISVNGTCYMWDYNLGIYYNTGKADNDASRLCWFKFDNWNANQYINVGDELYYSYENKLITCKAGIYNDFGEPIHAIYQTPLFQFKAQSYLKTIKNIYIQCRGDEATTINLKYITEDNPDGEIEPEPIIINTNGWDTFTWSSFVWSMAAFGTTFRRKCQLKKIQMASLLFENNDADRDMSISHLAIEYSIVKPIK